MPGVLFILEIMAYWLIKSEPTCYSIDDLKRDKKTTWSGVRNYQARNFMQAMKKGDEALFYHSSADVIGAVGVTRVVAEAYADKTALDKKDDHYDPKATPEKPIWANVDFAFVQKVKTPVTLSQIKFDPALAGIMVAERGSRLSVQPVSEKHFKRIMELGKK
jgi:predicted RNA-binding protein with PUA-like domain